MHIAPYCEMQHFNGFSRKARQGEIMILYRGVCSYMAQIIVASNFLESRIYPMFDDAHDAHTIHGTSATVYTWAVPTQLAISECNCKASKQQCWHRTGPQWDSAQAITVLKNRGVLTDGAKYIISQVNKPILRA